MSTSQDAAPLPESGDLPVRFLAAALKDTTNSYKYLWLLALVEAFRERRRQGADLRVPQRELLARMLKLAWYPYRQFRLSFGAQDQIGKAVSEIGQALGEEKGKGDVALGEILAALEESPRLRRGLARYVPFRFLSPWFSDELRGQRDARRNDLIREAAAKYYTSHERVPLYRFAGAGGEHIEVHPEWADYLYFHSEIVAGFARWNLVRYLEVRNPGVPNLAGKLTRPESRSLSQPRALWKTVLDRAPEFRCIYTDEPVTPAAFALDHFVPWSFVAHDLLWNLVPVPEAVNSMKGDKLPSPDRYLRGFASAQRRAFHVWQEHSRKTKAMQEYVDVFRSEPREISRWDESEFERRLRSVLIPLLETARVRGFRQWQEDPEAA